MGLQETGTLDSVLLLNSTQIRAGKAQVGFFEYTQLPSNFVSNAIAFGERLCRNQTSFIGVCCAVVA